jgi:hypothetical protein
MNHILSATSLNEFKELLHNRYPVLTGNLNGVRSAAFDDTNSYGFRGNEPLPVVDICYYGCSFTFGHYVDYKDCWTKIVDNHTQLTSNNFGIPAASIEQILIVFAASLKFFKMKKAFFLLPEPIRQHMAVEKLTENKFKYSNVLPGKPHKFAEAWLKLPNEYYLDKALSTIGLIQCLAKLSNIETYWSSWDSEIYDVLPKNKIALFCNDKLASDNRHPGPVAHYNFAQEVIKIL